MRFLATCTHRLPGVCVQLVHPPKTSVQTSALVPDVMVPTQEVAPQVLQREKVLEESSQQWEHQWFSLASLLLFQEAVLKFAALLSSCTICTKLRIGAEGLQVLHPAPNCEAPH